MAAYRRKRHIDNTARFKNAIRCKKDGYSSRGTTETPVSDLIIYCDQAVPSKGATGKPIGSGLSLIKSIADSGRESGKNCINMSLLLQIRCREV
ncbi:hypothetical protein CHS0354_042054 [Potamilus streckersoni]|uniref:Uncharacterized protein n=1 Tax=Potamilus streckersoni TaxID=2493646 RepID=A0AAE0W9V7_9BIVA|nr:hypothetical protein CHS0354_042054 [Potamilus streckersoni]